MSAGMMTNCAPVLANSFIRKLLLHYHKNLVWLVSESGAEVQAETVNNVLIVNTERTKDLLV